MAPMPYPRLSRKKRQVLRSVSLRESRLTEVEQALQAFQWHRGRDTDAVGLVAALAGLRSASLGVIRAVVVSGRVLLSLLLVPPPPPPPACCLRLSLTLT